MIQRVVAHHLEVLGVMARRCLSVVRIERRHETGSFDRLLRDAIDYLLWLDSGRFQDRRYDINHVSELMADAALVLDYLRPGNRHSLPHAAEMGRYLLGPRKRCVEGP